MFVESSLYSWDDGVGVCRSPGVVDMEWLAVSDWVWVTKYGWVDREKFLQGWVLYTFVA